MRRVVLESPYKGDVMTNLRYAKACVRDCIRRGEAPIASHLLFTQEGILDDTDPVQRAAGINAGHAWIPLAQALVVYTDLGISHGMQEGMDVAMHHHVPIEERSIKGTDW
jgi:hypothetical protein